jgi:hypothetical protein
MISKVNIYYFINLTTHTTYLCYTNENIDIFINQNKLNNIDKTLYTILQTKYSYQIVLRYVLTENVERFITLFKTDKIRLNIYIRKTYADIINEKKLIIGANNEIQLQPIIEKVFNVEIIKSINRYDIYDFYDVNHKYVFELKSLDITKYVFFGVNKTKNIGEFSLICIFKCNNSGILYYLIYNKKLFELFELKQINSSFVYVIPLKHLTQFTINDEINLT